MTDVAEKILNDIISAEIGSYMCTYAPDKAVLQISNIKSFNKGLKMYRIRKAIKELIAEGLIYYTSQGCPAIESCGEYRELIAEARPPINGYALTKKCFKSDMWKQKYDEWNRSMEEWANEPYQPEAGG